MTPQQFDKAMGAILDRHRTLRGLTMEAVGAHMGVSYQQVQKYCSGINTCSVFRLSQFADLFGMEMSDLLKELETIPKSEYEQQADNQAFLAGHYLRQITDGTLRRALLEHIQNVALKKGRAA